MKHDSLTEMFVNTSNQLVLDASPHDVNFVCRMFIRKYTHARIGGYIKGQHEKVMESKGIRAKGACSLRDKLYNVSNGKNKAGASAGAKKNKR